MRRRRRPLRILLNAATGVSLVLCATSAGLWMDAQKTGRTVTYRWLAGVGPVREREISVWVYRGSARVEVATATFRSYTPEDTPDLERAALGVERGMVVTTWRPSPMPDFARDGRRAAAAWGFGWERRDSARETPDPPYLSPVGRELHPHHLRLSALAVPWWFLTVLLGAAPALALPTWIRVLRRIRQPRAGICPACGYDLRATPARCPECGAVLPPLPPA